MKKWMFRILIQYAYWTINRAVRYCSENLLIIYSDISSWTDYQYFESHRLSSDNLNQILFQYNERFSETSPFSWLHFKCFYQVRRSRHLVLGIPIIFFFFLFQLHQFTFLQLHHCTFFTIAPSHFFYYC
jgi:hypothetical protein